MDRDAPTPGRLGPSDTSPDVERRLAELYRALTPEQKLSRALALTEAVHGLALSRIREQHPEETLREHRLRLMARYTPRELMLAAFGWDPAERGP